jgi:hypothetical protein
MGAVRGAGTGRRGWAWAQIEKILRKRETKEENIFKLCARHSHEANSAAASSP